MLGLGNIDFQHFFEVILQPVPVRIGSGQSRGDLGAEDRCGRHAEGVEQNGDIETAIVKNLLAGRVGKHPDEVRRFLLTGGNANDVRRAVARRKLNDAEAVAARHQSQRFRIDCDGAGVTRGIFGGNIAFVVTDGCCHVLLQKFQFPAPAITERAAGRYRFIGSPSAPRRMPLALAFAKAPGLGSGNPFLTNRMNSR